MTLTWAEETMLFSLSCLADRISQYGTAASISELIISLRLELEKFPWVSSHNILKLKINMIDPSISSQVCHRKMAATRDFRVPLGVPAWGLHQSSSIPGILKGLAHLSWENWWVACPSPWGRKTPMPGSGFLQMSSSNNKLRSLKIAQFLSMY